MLRFGQQICGLNWAAEDPIKLSGVFSQPIGHRTAKFNIDHYENEATHLLIQLSKRCADARGEVVTLDHSHQRIGRGYELNLFIPGNGIVESAVRRIHYGWPRSM